jgi:hypothetical protein
MTEPKSKTTKPCGCPTPGACSAQVEIGRLRQVLLRLRSSLLSPVNEGTISDTLWMDLPCPETVLDFIDSELEVASAKA